MRFCPPSIRRIIFPTGAGSARPTGPPAHRPAWLGPPGSPDRPAVRGGLAGRSTPARDPDRTRRLAERGGRRAGGGRLARTTGSDRSSVRRRGERTAGPRAARRAWVGVAVDPEPAPARVRCAHVCAARSTCAAIGRSRCRRMGQRPGPDRRHALQRLESVVTPFVSWHVPCSSGSPVTRAPEPRVEARRRAHS